MRVALVYDRVNKWGGAERVLLALQKLFPQSDLFTSVYDKKGAFWAKKFNKITSSFLQKIPYAKKTHELFAVFMPLSFEQFSFDGYDLVISVTSEAAKGIITKPGTRHVCICLTPTRYLWSGYKDYFNNPILRFIAKPLISYLREWDRIASMRPDSYIAISETVQKRIKRYYDRPSILINPPLTLDLPMLSLKKKRKNPKGYFLIVSRLVAYKRIDLAVLAANELSFPLIIIGEGSEAAHLKSIAGPTVQFLGRVSDEKLVYYYDNCIAFLFPGKEDFGLTMVEAQGCGKPVVAYKKGGAREIIIEGATGEFFEEQTVESLVGLLKRFNSADYNTIACMRNAKRFSYDVFSRKITKFLKKEKIIV